MLHWIDPTYILIAEEDNSNQININIEESKVLDLYSGFGSFGLECISRLADKVIFMEKDKKVVSVIKKNLKNLNI